MIHKIKSYKLSDYDLLGEGKAAETTDPLDLTDANEAMGKMCEKHGVVACEDRGCMEEAAHMHEEESKFGASDDPMEEVNDAEMFVTYEEGEDPEEIKEVNAEILSMYEDDDADDSDTDDDDAKRAELEKQIKKGGAPQRDDEGMKMNEGLSRFEELAFGKMRPAPQPGVETDSQVEESHGTLLRRRYFGRY